jgi:hypothetical protein
VEHSLQRAQVRNANQMWWLLPVAADTYAIVQGQSSKCLEVADAALGDAAPVHQGTCHFGPNQQWRLAPP